MADIRAIQSVGETLRVYLQATYPAELQALHPCSFEVISGGQLANFVDPAESNVAITLYLYQVTINEAARNHRSPPHAAPGALGLPLELHWLMTVWASSAAAEQIVFAWAMRQLHDRQLLDAAFLTEEGRWGPDEVVQLLPEELSVETMMRIWDAIDPSYRLSASYVTRVVWIDRLLPPGPPRVVSGRLSVATSSDEEKAREEGP